MAGLGAEVRRLREAKGASLDQVAAATKVGVHHLAALERDEFSALPGDVFVVGFIRAYADFLGAQSERLLALYRRDRERLEPDSSPAMDRTVQEMSRILVGRSGGAAGRRGLALRFTIDRKLRKLILPIAGLALAVAGAAALAIVWSGRRGDTVPPQSAAPLRASRRAADLPPTARVGPPVLPAPSASAPVVEIESKPATAGVREHGPQVPEHGVGSGVEGGQLAGRATTFEEGAGVWFWTRIDGGQPGQIIRHVWLHDDREVHSVELKVGSAQWRTWSQKTMRPGSAGHWSVEARDAYGRALASEEFDCRPRR